MTKLDEIQERIHDLIHATNHSPDIIMELIELVGALSIELKRIDAERKAMDKLLIELAARDT